MKKIGIILSLIVSSVILLGCASKAATVDQTAPVAQPSHQDLKGEVGNK